MSTKTKAKHIAGPVDEFADAKRKIVTVNGVEMGIYSVNGQFYAWRNICPHAYAPVCEGRVCGTRLPSMVYEYIPGRDGEIVRCPWHGWEFDLLTGRHLADESVKLKGYEVVVEDGQLLVLM